MSSPRYCDNPEPHPGHDWSLTTEPGPVWSGGTDFFFCWGVKKSREIQTWVSRKKAAERSLAGCLNGLRDASKKNRRTQAEFYGGDGTKCEVCLDKGWLKDVPCEGCGKVAP